MKKLFIIAGEASGDILGANLLQALKKKHPDLEVYGIGGKTMLKNGLPESLFPMEELSIMGVAEILPKILHMLKRIRQTAKEIIRIQPDILITIDSPDFSFRVQKRVKIKTTNIKQVHYVAPTVWAWREGRAEKISKFLDGILCLFPFEPPYFEKVGMKAKYTGHPVIDCYSKAPARVEARKAFHFSDDETVIGLLLGSRRGELKKHSKTFFEAIRSVMAPDVRILIPTLPHLRDEVAALVYNHFGDMDDFKKRFIIVSNMELQTTYFRAMDCALAVSGTVGLELAVAGVPHIIGYKANQITAEIVKRVVKVEYAHLANLILDKEVVPEFIQEKCTPDILSKSILGLLDRDTAQTQINAFNTLRTCLATKETPANTAVEFLEVI